MAKVLSRTRPTVVSLAFTLMLLSNFGSSPASAQLITMSKECRAQVAQGNEMNAARDYRRALDLFTGIAADCDTKDGKEAVQVGIASAQNGLYNYPANRCRKSCTGSQQGYEPERAFRESHRAGEIGEYGCGDRRL